ncbi:MAG: 4-hydroxy-tetrahydrodipicolinate synthase [Bacteroidetes bacterium]|nr:4-hydroxy-tetrahydrodipicolinate synthase [Bacteroidota bacterium]
MEISKFHGTGVALVTPFNRDLTIDWEGLTNLLEHTISNGVDYLVAMGTTGESATTTFQEKMQVLEFVTKNNNSNKPIVFGLGGNNTQSILESIKNTDFGAVDAILSVSPYYNKPTQPGLIEHYRSLADTSPVPVIIYNVPGRTSSNITADTTIELAQHPNIIGVKEASGNLDQCIKIAKYTPDDFLLISGDDLLTVPLISIGACGAISVLANALPKIFSQMVSLALNGNYVESRKYLNRIYDINPLMYVESNPVGVKQALQLLGICKNYVRSPLLPASQELQKEITSRLKKLN